MSNANISNISTRTVFPLDTSNEYPITSLFDADADRQVREDGEFYVPNLLSDKDYDASPKAYAAFATHAKLLHKAEGLVDDAWNLARLMRASIGDECDGRAMRTDAGLKVIEKKLNKAHNHIDRLHTRYENLFFAYFDLKDKTDEDEK